MITAEALAIAALAKPKQPDRIPMDKLHRATAEGISAGVADLAKRYATMVGTVADMQRRIDQAAADVEFIKNYEPGQPPRRMHS